MSDEVEEEFATVAMEGDEADLVQDEQIEAIEAPRETPQFPSVTCLDELARQVGGTEEGDPTSLFGRLDSQCKCQMRLARAHGSSNDNVLLSFEPVAPGKLCDQGLVDTLVGSEGELIQGFQVGEACFTQAMADRGIRA